MKFSARRFLAGLAFIVVAMAHAAVSIAADEAATKPSLPLLIEEKFAAGADAWKPMDPAAWKIIDIDGGKAFSQFAASKFSPPHRSPVNFALLNDVVVGDFVLEVKAQSTRAEYGHRDVCLIFGYQDPAHFHYVHFATKADDRANQIFIVNDAPRVKISEKSSDGVKWTEGWHKLKVVRKVADGTIETYFDDMTTPLMVAHDKTFTWGQIGIGTFDDTANFAEVKLWGEKVEPKKTAAKQ